MKIILTTVEKCSKYEKKIAHTHICVEINHIIDEEIYIGHMNVGGPVHHHVCNECITIFIAIICDTMIYFE